jgi:hypothetical protein
MNYKAINAIKSDILGKCPKLRYKSYTDYIIKDHYRKNGLCPECVGYGLMYDDADRDCIEGYKLASRKITCTKCGGTGKLTEAQMKIDYKKIRSKDLESIRKYKSKDLSVIKVLRKLSSDDAKHLGLI